MRKENKKKAEVCKEWKKWPSSIVYQKAKWEWEQYSVGSPDTVFFSKPKTNKPKLC